MNEYKPEGSLIATQKNFEYISTAEGLERALKKQVILEGCAVLCDHNMDLHVDLPSGITGIIPHDEVQYTKRREDIKDIAILTRVGKTVCFKVMGLKTAPSGETVAILSRRAAQAECYENFVATLIPGDIIESRVTHLENFGAFVDIGCGIVSLLSIDCISVSRITHPSARFSPGDRIYTVVKGFDEHGRVFVSSRELFGTWEENAREFSEGQTVSGIVRSVESYGIFIELAPNLAGLAEYRDGVYPNQCAAVYIKSIIPDKMKIKLILIDTVENTAKQTRATYFIDAEKVRHIDLWRYSPASSKRIIETVFQSI